MMKIVDANIILRYLLNDTDIKRHGDGSSVSLTLFSGDIMKRFKSPSNEFDKYAVKALDKENKHIGYLPRYYSENISGYLNRHIISDILYINMYASEF